MHIGEHISNSDAVAVAKITDSTAVLHSDDPHYEKLRRHKVIELALGRCRRGPAQAWPSSSASTSATDRALPSSAVRVRCWRRPRTTTRRPLARDSATWSAWARRTTTV